MRSQCYVFLVALLFTCALVISCSLPQYPEIPDDIPLQARPVWLFLKAIETQAMKLAQLCSSTAMKRQVKAKGGWSQVLEANSREIGSKVKLSAAMQEGHFIYDEKYQTVTFVFEGKPLVSFQVVKEDTIWKIDTP